MILVVNRGDRSAERLCQLIEFMDNSDVYATTPGEWKTCLGNARLDALFVGADLVESEVDTLLSQVGELDPDVPIVLMHGEQE